MHKHPDRNSNLVNCRRDIDGYEELEALALNLLWSWNHCGDKVWQELDSNLWNLTQNPWVILQTYQ